MHWRRMISIRKNSFNASTKTSLDGITPFVTPGAPRCPIRIDSLDNALHICSIMKTATVRQLRNQYRSVLGWVEAGEEVTISKRGKVIARLVPEKAKSRQVDWAKSAALQMERKALPVL